MTTCLLTYLLTYLLINIETDSTFKELEHSQTLDFKKILPDLNSNFKF